MLRNCVGKKQRIGRLRKGLLKTGEAWVKKKITNIENKEENQNEINKRERGKKRGGKRGRGTKASVKVRYDTTRPFYGQTEQRGLPESTASPRSRAGLDLKPTYNLARLGAVTDNITCSRSAPGIARNVPGIYSSNVPAKIPRSALILLTIARTRG